MTHKVTILKRIDVSGRDKRLTVGELLEFIKDLDKDIPIVSWYDHGIEDTIGVIALTEMDGEKILSLDSGDCCWLDEESDQLYERGKIND